MKTIGFIDYYLSEWHANHYPKWIAEASERIGEEFVVKYAWAEEYVSPIKNVNTDEWCAKYGVEKCASIEEVCEKADYICILAPSNPEKHLEYAEKALRYGKNTYIDKTFAPDLATAEKIFEAAEKYGTKFFSSSALRYATELAELEGTKSVITTGGGSNLPEYIIHQAEMIVKLFGASEILRVKAEPQGENQCTIRAEFEGGKECTMVYSSAYPFTACGEIADGVSKYAPAQSEYFAALIEDVLRFYLTGETSFDTRETLCVIKLREMAIKAKEQAGKWITE